MTVAGKINVPLSVSNQPRAKRPNLNRQPYPP